MDKSRYLITTADERTWVFDRPVLFLGEWCCRYDRKHIWSKMDAVVAEPYILKNSYREKEILYLEAIKSRLLVDMRVLLNQFHQTKHNKRYWEVVIGHWLRAYVPMMYNRYKTLEKVLKKYNIVGTAVLDVKQDILLTTDSSQFIWKCNQDLWNHKIYSELLRWMNDLAFDTIIVDLGQKKRIQKKQITTNLEIRAKLRRWISQGALVFRKKTDALILSTYLPKKEALKLHIALYQFPQLWNVIFFERVKGNIFQRNTLGLNLEGFLGVEKYIRQKVIQFIPSCYLEGYEKLVQKTKQVDWPSEPKFIFTSNNFDSDEVFKVWLGTKIEQGTPYFAGQHGNNYETHFESKFCPEVSTSDKFFTWGWSHDNDKHIPAFLFKIAGKKSQFDSKGGLLLIEVSQPHWFGPFDEYKVFSSYQEDQFKFVGGLSKDIHKKLLVRLHHEHKVKSWYEEQRWADVSPETKLEMGTQPIFKLISRSRLIVHSYDSTGVLETLALNIPTICFWSNGFEHLLASAKPYYDLLSEAGIYQSTPEKASKFIVENWDDLDAWWFSDATQKARKIFCDRYAKIEKKPVRKLKKLLEVSVKSVASKIDKEIEKDKS